MSAHSHDDHHGHSQTRRYRRDTEPAKPGLWPLWIYLALAVAFVISMVVTGRESATTDAILTLVWVAAYIMAPVSLIMIFVCLTDKYEDVDGEKERDMKGVVIFLIALVISLIIGLFIAGPIAAAL